MSYIVCRNCNTVIKVSPNTPLNFDKCENCGHLLQFAADDRELSFLLNDIEIPRASTEKICRACGSENPRETGACLSCGATDFEAKIDEESMAKFRTDIVNASGNKNKILLIPDDGENGQSKTILINPVPKTVFKSSGIILKIISLIIGFIDFMFFTAIGFSIVLGDRTMPTTTEAIMNFVAQNINPLLIVLVLSLILAGAFAIFIQPSMKYREAFKISILLGLIIGLSTLTVMTNIPVVIAAMLLCGILTGIGGIFGEFIIKKLNKTLKGKL